MKKQYMTPEMEMTVMEQEAVICSSGTPDPIEGILMGDKAASGETFAPMRPEEILGFDDAFNFLTF